jgi:hypothetical protein
MDLVVRHEPSKIIGYLTTRYPSLAASIVMDVIEEKNKLPLLLVMPDVTEVESEVV